MVPQYSPFSWKQAFVVVALIGVALPHLSGCSGFAFPPIPVSFPLLMDVEISAISAADGSADVVLGAFCDLFDEEDLDAMVRAAAGDLIADLVVITRVELESVDITATAGDFAAYTDAELRMTVVNPVEAPLSLGTARNSEGLGSAFGLTREIPVDLLNELEDGQCGVPTLHLDGGGLLQPGDTTFNAGVSVLVYTQVR